MVIVEELHPLALGIRSDGFASPIERKQASRAAAHKQVLSAEEELKKKAHRRCCALPSHPSRSSLLA